MSTKLREYHRRLSRTLQRWAWGLGAASVAWIGVESLLDGTLPAWPGGIATVAAIGVAAFRQVYEAKRETAVAGELRTTDDALEFETKRAVRTIQRDSIASVLEAVTGLVVSTKDGRVFVLEDVPDVLRARVATEFDVGRAVELEGAPRPYAGQAGCSTLVIACMVGAVVVNVLPTAFEFMAVALIPFLVAATVSLRGSTHSLRIGADGIRYGKRFIPIASIKSVVVRLRAIRVRTRRGKPLDIPLGILGARMAFAAQIRRFMEARGAPVDSTLFEAKTAETESEWVNRVARAVATDDYRGQNVTREMARAVASDARTPLRVRVAALAGVDGDDIDGLRALTADPQFDEAAVAALESHDALAAKLASLD